VAAGRDEYLSARAALVGQVERQGSRAPVRAPATSYVDVVFDGQPGPLTQGFVEVEDDQGRSLQYGEWVERDDACGRRGPLPAPDSAAQDVLNPAAAVGTFLRITSSSALAWRQLVTSKAALHSASFWSPQIR
jgi:hypothetical protein